MFAKAFSNKKEGGGNMRKRSKKRSFSKVPTSVEEQLARGNGNKFEGQNFLPRRRIRKPDPLPLAANPVVTVVIPKGENKEKIESEVRKFFNEMGYTDPNILVYHEGELPAPVDKLDTDFHINATKGNIKEKLSKLRK